ncbi:uncharacterized protein si:dkey-33c12.4 isoform X2 [Alosa sapidissima]|uniref:uncharacterized protein si:dkey-33c12.4 isoform X2 n=1 Tax=Alosa sapidissima TaxID=34773 RepID=UPI001C09D97C|nr:uncharacterized protein si:dkey-33c12.4 isoform X2 [Alosa sapidissima]
MSSTGWPQDLLMGTQIMHSHETFVDMINGRRQFNLMDALGLDFDDGADDSDSSDEWGRPAGPYCGLKRNFLHRPGHVTVLTKHRPITREEIKKAEKTAEELIEEEERLKKKAEKKKLKKMRQKQKKRLEKQEKENANKANDNQNKGEDNKKKNLNKKSAESPPDTSHRSNSDASTEEEDDKGSISSEKGHQKKKKQLQKQEKKIYNKTNDEQTINYNEAVSIKEVKSKTRQCNSDASSDEDEEKESMQSDLEDLDMSSCFVSNAAAAFAKRKQEKAKEKKEKMEKKTADSVKDSQKHCTEQQHTKPHQKEVIPLSTQSPVKVDSERNVADLIARSMELAYMGNQYAASGDLERAVKYFTDAIIHNPTEYKLFGNRAFCFEKMQQYEKSLMDANVALSMNPQWIKGLYRKGRALTGLKRYMEAMVVYKEVLTLDKSCAEAAQELIKVQILQLMEMGFTKEQSTNAMVIYGSVEKALDALSGLQGSFIPTKPSAQEWVQVDKHSQSPKPISQGAPQVQQPVPHIQPRLPASSQPKLIKPELFPIWVGCPVPTLTEAFIYDLFNQVGPVHSVKVLRNKGCAFVNYIRKEDSDEAIKKLHGYIVASGTPLQVRYPDRIHPHLGVSKAAAVEHNDKLPDECHFWRTIGCIKNQHCQYRHVPENKGIDRNKVK